MYLNLLKSYWCNITHNGQVYKTNSMRKIILKIITKIILKRFSEGVKPIYGSNEWSNKIIAYQWTWKNEDTYKWVYGFISHGPMINILVITSLVYELYALLAFCFWAVVKFNEMDKIEFNEKHKEIIIKHDVCFEPDCDAWFMVKGFLYYENSDKDDGKFITHITGIGFDEDGDIYGNCEGYLSLLDKELSEFRGTLANEH